MLDKQDRISLSRVRYTHAEEYHVDTARIGVMGFSAGGHLAMSSYVYNHTDYKPSFICPVYPVVTMKRPYVHHRTRRGALGVWGQWNKLKQDSLSLEQHISPSCPPVFLVNCEDDPVVKYQNSILLDSALTAKADMDLAVATIKEQMNRNNGKMNLYNGYRISDR